MSASLTADQIRFSLLIKDRRLTPDLMLDVLNEAMGLQPDLRRPLPTETRQAPPGAGGLVAAWPSGALAAAVAAQRLGPLCDALEERLERYVPTPWDRQSQLR